MERHTAFDTSHPAVPAAYVAITLALTMCSLQPVLIALSIAGALAYACRLHGLPGALGPLRWQLPVIAIVALANPLFSASGSTELFRIGHHAVYLESLCYGAAMGGMLVASMAWLRSASELLGFDKVMALFGNAAPVIALMVSMSMRLIPRFLRKGRMVLAVQDCIGRSLGESGADAVRQRLRLSSVLMGWGMEDSLETADAMRARGWGGAPRRTTYTRHRFTGADAAALLALAASGVLVAALAWVATSQYEFYPQMSRLAPWWGYIAYGAWMLVPAVLDARVQRSFG